jgi:RND family efflux transporter MFP subunit
MANPNADLGALTVRRSAEPDVRPPRRLVSRVVIPGVILAGFVALLGWASRDLLFPPLAVKVVPVQVRTGVAEEAGQELFQANGWIEPRPLPVDVPVQTEGMYRVKEVRVNPGDRVRAGQVLVLLDDEKAQLDREAARSRHAKTEAARRSAEAEQEKAKVAVANAGVAVDLARREGEVGVRTEQAEVSKAEAVLAAAEYAVELEEGLLRSGAATSEAKVKRARQQRDVAAAEVGSARAKLAQAQVAADVRLRLAETARAAAEADLAGARAKAAEAAQTVAEAAVQLKTAELELARTRIVAPIDGAVMQLNARVGSVLGGRPTGPNLQDVVATLYDPRHLQVRVEVPVTKFQHVRHGQPVEVEVEDVLPGKVLTGTVLYDTRLANVARNSVPVKVSLPDNPPEQLRPEMIASVRFKAPPRKDAPRAESVRRTVVPRRLLVTEGEQVRVWVVDAVTGRAEQRAIELAPGERNRTGESVEVVSGLQPTDKLIATGLEQLKPGLRVQVVGEER